MAEPTSTTGENTRNNESEINIESIISAPFIAASKANTMMLSGQARFILDYCFQKRKKDGEQEDLPDYRDFDTAAVYDPVMINLSMRKSVIQLRDDPNNPGQQIEDVKEHTAIIAVPLLSLLPINSIAIEKIKVDFNMEITSITSYNNQSNPIIEKKAQLNGKISSDKNPVRQKNESLEQKNSSNRTLSVQIEAGSLPLPLGILNLLDLYSKNIYPTQIK